MASLNPIEKGKELEHAVHFIERAILSSFKKLTESDFRIENRKIIKSENVRHEVDIFVEVISDFDYGSVFIFECKNWKEKVGKNEIIIFSEKIKISEAQRGFFVAKSFTADAVAQAKADPRIKLLYATERTPGLLPNSFHILWHEVKGINIIAQTIESLNSGEFTESVKQEPMNFGEYIVLLNQEPIDFQKYLYEWASKTASHSLRSFSYDISTERVFELKANDQRQFENKELTWNGQSIGLIKLEVNFVAEVIIPAIRSDYEIESRGRVCRLETTRRGDTAFEISLAALPPSVR